MARMSRAIREELQRNGHQQLRDIPDDELGQYAEIVSAFAKDLLEEVIRRKGEARTGT